MKYQCNRCGAVHDGPPLSYAASAPAIWHDIPANERKRRIMLSSDQCVIDRQYFFIVGNIEIPIIDTPDIFVWSVWVSLNNENYQRTSKFWNKAGRESERPYFGWLSTQLVLYPNTLNLKTLVHTRPVGQRPMVELEPTDHPLALEQRNGISMERVQEIAELILHDLSKHYSA